MRIPTRGALAALLVLALPVAAAAQEDGAPEAAPQRDCTAAITPIPAAAQAQATATFDAPFGTVSELKGPEKSGLKLVKEVQPEKTEMAAEPEEVIEEEMDAAEENTVTFRVDASRTSVGTYDIVLKNEAGETCSAQLTVQESPGGDADR